MDLGAIFRTKPGGDIYKAQAAIDGRCLGCVAINDKALCHSLPMCYDAKSKPSFIYTKLTKAEAAKAAKGKKAIPMAADL